MKTGIFLIVICTLTFVFGVHADVPSDDKVLVIGIPFLIVLAIAASFPFTFINKKTH